MNEFLLVAVPYAAVAVAVGGGIVRYRRDRFSWSTQSSQFLENRTLFWGSNAIMAVSPCFIWWYARRKKWF